MRIEILLQATSEHSSERGSSIIILALSEQYSNIGNMRYQLKTSLILTMPSDVLTHHQEIDVLKNLVLISEIEAMKCDNLFQKFRTTKRRIIYLWQANNLLMLNYATKHFVTSVYRELMNV